MLGPQVPGAVLRSPSLQSFWHLKIKKTVFAVVGFWSGEEVPGQMVLDVAIKHFIKHKK